MKMIDINDQNLKWRERLTVAKELALFAAGVAMVMVVVMTFLNFLTDQCQRGTPRLTALFNCFPQR